MELDSYGRSWPLPNSSDMICSFWILITTRLLEKIKILVVKNDSRMVFRWPLERFVPVRHFRFPCERNMLTRGRAHVVWKSAMIKNRTSLLHFLCSLGLKIKNQSIYEADTKKIFKRLHAETKNDAWDTRDFTVWRRMMLGSKSRFELP